MKMLSRFLKANVAVVGLALPCAAQTTPTKLPDRYEAADSVNHPVSHQVRPHQLRPQRLGTYYYQPCEPAKPFDPTKPVDPTPVDPTAAPTPESLPMGGGYKSSFGTGTAVSAASGIGASVASAAAGLPATPNGANVVPSGNARTATLTTNATPLIMPGFFSATSSQSAIPVDRFSFDYGYYNRFATVGAAGVAPGFNLHQFNFSVEKTFFSGMTSVYVMVPFLNATENTTDQQINGLGDVSAGFKVLLYQNRDAGTAFSAGFTVAAPTAHPSRFTQTSTLNLTFTGPARPGLPIGANLPVTPFTQTVEVNPTFFQPWGAFMWAGDRFFIHEYVGVLIPSDDRVSTIINNHVTMGYTLYQNPNAFVASITPIVGVQLLLPVNHRNNSVGSTTTTVPVDINCNTLTFPEDQFPQVTNFGFPDQVFVTGGVQLGLGERAIFTGSVVVPVAGPRGYAVGGTVGLTFLY